MAEIVLSLPLPLLLLVHLHILDYHHANEPEYDHRVFDPRTRGLRDRTKTMEDVCYFLVGRLERKDAKTVLPTYPCLQPSDTTAFRTSLAKYLESLRNQAIYPSSGIQNRGSIRDKGKLKISAPESFSAWWWKDVVVRKSLLEECAGERFERLLVALSTHALLKNIPGPSGNVGKEDSLSLVHVQPGLYTSSLTVAQSTRHMWERSAFLVVQRQSDLARIRYNVTNNGGPSMYDTLTTDRLLAFSQSKLQDLIRNYWKESSEGRHTLDTLKELAGVQPTAACSTIPKDRESSFTLNGGCVPDTTAPPVTIPPLPIAAAHHPSNLRKLRAPIFPSASKPKSRRTSLHPKPACSHATIALSEPLRTEEEVQRTLRDALARARKVGEELSLKVRQMKRQEVGAGLTLNLESWDEEAGADVNFMTTPTTELLSSLSLYTPPEEGALESRIDFIRESQLPPFPAIPEAGPSVPPSPPRSPSHVFPPQLTAQTPTPPQTPRQLQTSTPPASIKPRSAYARRVLAEQDIKATAKTAGRVVTFKTPVGRDRNNNRMSRCGTASARKSIRRSLGLMRRPSLFGPEVEVSLDDADNGEDEVNKILDAVEDGCSTSFEQDPVTPRLKTPVNRIITSGSPVKRSNNGRNMLPRLSFAIPDRKSLVALPDGSARDLLRDEWMDDEDGEEHDKRGDGEDVEGHEGNSITLRDLLLKAGDDVTQFDLMEGGQPLIDESFGWD